MKVFEARFDSECDSCFTEIEKGDAFARTSDGDHVCLDCAEDDADQQNDGMFVEP